MAVLLENVQFPPFHNLTLRFGDGVVAGILGTGGSGVRELLELIGGQSQCRQGRVIAQKPLRWIGPFEYLPIEPPRTLILSYNLDTADLFEKRLAVRQIERWRRQGTTVLVG